MKFGTKILNKSVPEWKLHNIDYEKLKKAIKRATVTSADGNDRENLENCTQLFKEQFGSINVFTSLKVKEISSRLVAIEASIINFKKRFSDAEDNRKLRSRQIKLISTHLDNCSSELQRLSRYLILQKIAVGKLFKKLIKHYPGGAQQARAYIQEIRELPELVDGYGGISFTKVDLDPYLLEVSLIVNVLHHLRLGLSEAVATSAKGNIDSSLAFDTQFCGRFASLQKFLISAENLEEFKFMILHHGFHVVADEIISTSRSIREASGSLNTMETRSIRSARSFKALQQVVTCQQPANLSGSPASMLQEQEIHVGKPVSSGTLFHSTSPRLCLSILDSKDKPSLLEDDTINQHPNLVMISGNGENHCVVMCHVGGLRDHLETADLSYREVAQIWDGETIDLESQEMQERPPMAKLAIEWIQSRRLKPVEPKIYFKRVRFICNEDDKTYLIALDEEITIDNLGTLPHAFVEIRKLPAPLASDDFDDKLVDLCEALIENKTQAYPLSSNMTLWRLCFELRHSKELQADLFDTILKEEFDLEDESPTSEDFFLLGKSSTLQKCSDKFRSNFESEDMNKRRSTIHVTPKEQQSIEKPRVRYWNEFDDDPEFYNDNGFYIDGTHGSADGEGVNPNSGCGFILFNKQFIENTYRLCQRVSGWFDLRDTKLVPVDASRYGSIGESTSSASANSINDVEAYLAEEDDESGQVYEYKHDQVITFMYLSSLLAACVTSGISFGIVLGLFHKKETDDDLEVADFLISMISLSLIISLVLICSSLLLLFSRYRLAPAWHYISCFVLFLLVILTVCYGFIEVFF
ncbi:hypothetical protein HG536_0H03120 [Torulaspora globosa]|uniref:SPX domain-containing protein n=1 Tax=Torulaspora globosa TaxID=48254 RepID=A0A7G3ZN51_9SACH|nr:uncharacterized protein HG536_0H03120 [Torulaspora globosa]QLL34937.1 hypothetical protein HG536_0H03120 [Torulaspora globosa]